MIFPFTYAMYRESRDKQIVQRCKDIMIMHFFSRDVYEQPSCYVSTTSTEVILRVSSNSCEVERKIPLNYETDDIVLAAKEVCATWLSKMQQKNRGLQQRRTVGL